MLAIDKISKPDTFYYEDKNGNRVPFDWNNGFPDIDWQAQHSKGVIVQHTICFGKRKGEDAWPVRLAKWLLHKMPDKWKKPTTVYNSNTTINSWFPIIKYLVDRRNFKFSDACVIAAEMCGRCGDVCENEINGIAYVPDYKLPNVSCKYCEVVDPIYVLHRRVWCCYRTMIMKGDITKAYDENSPNSGKNYFMITPALK